MHADYIVELPTGPLTMRAGQMHPVLDDTIGNCTWAIVTAHNPDARQLTEQQNRGRHRRLLARLKQQGIDSWPGVNRDPSGRWPDETSVLVAGISSNVLDDLASRFGQAGALYGAFDKPARLRLYGPGWPSNLPAWAEHAF